MSIPDKRLSDPLGNIAAVRKLINRQCAVAKSPWVDHIISMRLQGYTYEQISDFLDSQESAISPTTLCRYLKPAIKSADVAGQLIESYGGSVLIDHRRELNAQIIIQRDRLNKMHAAERVKQQTSPGYKDRWIKDEIALLMKLIEARRAIDAPKPGDPPTGTDEPKTEPVIVSKDVEDMIKEAITSGKIKLKQTRN